MMNSVHATHQQCRRREARESRNGVMPVRYIRGACRRDNAKE